MSLKNHLFDIPHRKFLVKIGMSIQFVWTGSFKAKKLGWNFWNCNSCVFNQSLKFEGFVSSVSDI